MNKQAVIVLQRCYIQPFCLQSAYARKNSKYVAELASRGLITSCVGRGHYSNHWRVSAAGAVVLELTGD